MLHSGENLLTANQPLLRNWPRIRIWRNNAKQWSLRRSRSFNDSRSPILVPIESSYATSY